MPVLNVAVEDVVSQPFGLHLAVANHLWVPCSGLLTIKTAECEGCNR